MSALAEGAAEFLFRFSQVVAGPEADASKPNGICNAFSWINALDEGCSPAPFQYAVSASWH